jgi:DNA adenine methylase Dam
MLYSPINYQGNKSRIVEKLLQYIPKDTTSIHEIFCGSAILSFASDIERISINDTNHYILDLIEYASINDAEQIIERTDNIISQYGLTNTFSEGRDKYIEVKHEGLSRYNREPYNRLKADYNRDKDIAKLFVLIIYGFNHYLRFNRKDEFNIPVGKVDFVESLRKRTIEYCHAVQSKQIVYSNYDFRTPSLYDNAEETALFYFDPPYLITKAPYNTFWTERDEQDLLNLLDLLNERGFRFLLSNVTESNGKTNLLLKEWAKKYNLTHIKRQYLNSSYQKKNLSDADEVIIFNY